MKIKLLATGQAPDYYTFSGSTATAHYEGQSDSFDFSTLQEGDVFQGVDSSLPVPAIRNAEVVGGELRVTLCQQVGPGHWLESGWIDSASYDPDAITVSQDTSKAFSGTAWAKTRAGKVEA